MRRIAVAVLLLSAVFAPVARAAGAYVAWDECRGGGGASARTFACDTNSGSDAIWVSFVPPAGITQLTGITATLEIAVAPLEVMPDWWSFKNTGACRQTSLGVGYDFVGVSSACADRWGGQAAGGIGGYSNPFLSYAFRSRCTVVVAVPPSAYGPVDANTEYNAFRLAIDHARTVGAGSCAGCEQAVCVVATSFQLYQPVEVEPVPVEAVTAPVSFVTWQSVIPECPAYVPVRNRTWGAIKTLYR